MKLAMAIALGLLYYLPALQALELKSYVNEQGKTVFSNVPSKCIKDSRLLCMQYHPLIARQQSAKDLGNHAEGTQGEDKPRSANGTRSKTAKPDLPGSAVIAGRALKGLKGLVEANKIMDQHFPTANGY